jgi:hypothetical protein
MPDFDAAQKAIDSAGAILNNAWTLTGLLTGLDREIVRSRLENLGSLLQASQRAIRRQDGPSAYHDLQNCYAGADWVSELGDAGSLLQNNQSRVEIVRSVDPVLTTLRATVATALEALGYDSTQSPPPVR